jgi:hypothetical protein
VLLSDNLDGRSLLLKGRSTGDLGASTRGRGSPVASTVFSRLLPLVNDEDFLLVMCPRGNHDNLD